MTFAVVIVLAAVVTSLRVGGLGNALLGGGGGRLDRPGSSCLARRSVPKCQNGIPLINENPDIQYLLKAPQ